MFNQKEYNKQYYQENKESFKQYYRTNCERIRESTKEWRNKNPEYIKIWRKENRKKENKRTAAWRLENPEKYKESFLKSCAKYKKKNPVKIRAHDLLNLAIKCGKIKRGICVDCGDENTDGHHADYSKPLEVIWLCRIHHQQLHVKERIFK